MIHAAFRHCGLAAGRESLAAFTAKLLQACLDDHDWRDAQVSVLYCSEAEIRRLNRNYRGIDKPTDVLSFPATDDLESLCCTREPHLGDLAICLRYCARQAPEFGRRPIDEVALLLVHGFLHLVGYDHDTPAKEKRMWTETDRLLALSARLRRPRLALR